MKRERAAPGLLSLVVCCFVALLPRAASGSCPSPSTPACPAGTAYDATADRCQANAYPCLAGYAYDTATNQCEVAAQISTTSSLICPAGSLFSPSFSKCETANLSPCPSGFTYNAFTNICEIAATFTPASSCPDGYTFDTASSKCVGPPNSACSTFGGTWGYYERACTSGSELPGFGWDDETGQYVGPWKCAAGYSVIRSSGACSGPMSTASCPDGSTINTYTSKCEAVAGPACAAGQTYNTQNTECDFAPVISASPSACPPGYALNVDTNVCAGDRNSACPFGGSYGYYERACTSGSELPGFSWDDETGQYVGPWACPTGFALNRNTGSCSGAACPSGQVYDPATSTCETPPPAVASTLICPSGSSFNPTFNKCEAANLNPCPTGFSYNLSSNKCEIAATFTPAASCPDGYTWDSLECVGAPNSACSLGGTWGYYEQACTSGSELPGFGWDDETGQYVGPWICPPAYSPDRHTGACSGPMMTASCPSGGTINSYTSKCETAAGAVCAAGQTYNTLNTKCDFAPPVSPVAPICPPGYILGVDANRCVGVRNSACPFGGSYGWYERACTSGDPLPGFSWDDETGQYVGGWSCPAGFTVDRNTGSCSGAVCQAGYAYDAASSTCQLSGCPAGTVKSGSLCVAGPVCQ